MLKPSELTKAQLEQLVNHILISVYQTTDEEGDDVLDPDCEQTIQRLQDVMDDLEGADVAPDEIVPAPL